MRRHVDWERLANFALFFVAFVVPPLIYAAVLMAAYYWIGQWTLYVGVGLFVLGTFFFAFTRPSQ